MLPDERWIVTEHVCRRCLGAILELSGTQAGKIFMCSICRVRAEGAIDRLCGCGLTRRGDAGAGKKLPFRCTANPAPSPANPSAFVISFAAQTETVDA